MWKIHVTLQFFDASGPQDHFFEKKTRVFRYGLAECVYQIPGLYRFSLWPKGAVQTDKQRESQTHIYKIELKKTHSRSSSVLKSSIFLKLDWTSSYLTVCELAYERYWTMIIVAIVKFNLKAEW